MPFQRGDDANRRKSPWSVAPPHDPDRAQASGPASSGPTSNPPAQHFHCGLSSCGIKLISSTTGRPLPGVSICTSCCDVVWCAGCFLVAFIERLPHPIKCTQCGQPLAALRLQTRTIDGRVARTQSVTIPPPWTWTLGKHTRRLIAMPVDKRRGSMVLAVTVHPVVATYRCEQPLMYEQVFRPGTSLDGCLSGKSGALAVLLSYLHVELFREHPISSVDCHNLDMFQTIANVDVPPLFQILRVLGTGSTHAVALERLAFNYYDRKQANGLRAAYDVLCKLNSPYYCGPTQSLVNWVTRWGNATVRELTLRALCLAGTSESANRIEDERLASEFIDKPRNKFSSGTLAWSGGDNFGFKQRAGGEAEGGGSGYDQWYVPVKYQCSLDELKNLNGPLFNLLLPSMHERKLPPADHTQIFAPSAVLGDYMRRRRFETHSVASRIVLDMAALGGPEAAALLGPKARLFVNVHSDLPFHANGPSVRRLRAVAGVRSRGDGAKSHLEATGCNTDFPCHDDPSKTSILCELAQQHAEESDAEISRHLSTDPALTVDALNSAGELRFPARKMVMYMETDGKPARQLQMERQRRAIGVGIGKAIGASDLHAGLVQFPGGFHVGKTMMANIGVHSDCVSGPLAWLFLGSVGRVAYFQDPSDPRVPLNRWRQVVWATLCSIQVCVQV